MKKLLIALFALACVIAARADLLFSDDFNYPDGCIETDGVWSVYAPTTPHQDAFVVNDQLILNQTNYDAVSAPFPTNDAPIVVYASFNINVSQLPTDKGGFFCVLKDNTNDTVAHVFIDTLDTVVPGTYRLGIANFATAITTVGATNFPLDLATGVTYQVVFSWDETANVLGASFWVNPSSSSDQFVFGGDTTNTFLQNLTVSQIGFSQYANQGIVAIGNVMVGSSFSDVMTNVAQLPVIGIQPQGTSVYSGNGTTLYTAASGMDITYQWYSNTVALADDGVTTIGSESNVLVLNNLQATANYSVVVTDNAGSVTSAVAVVSVNATPTPPFFTLQPQGGTNSLDSPITLTASASGSGTITYQWYFEASGGSSFSPVSGQTSPSYSFTAAYANSGSYYVTATGSDGGNNSTTVSVFVIPPPLVTIGYMHSYITNSNKSLNINGGQVFNVEGIVTSIGQILSTGTAEFFIQDGTGGCLVYAGGFTPAKTPPVGALVNVVSPAQSYYGELEMDPTTSSPTNAVITLSTNNPLPAPIPLNLPLMATNTMGTYGLAVQCSLVSMTNVYLYSSSSGAAVTGNFPTNSSKALYAFQQPYSAGQPYIEVYVYTYTNALNQINTNYWGKPIPSQVYQLTGAQAIYSPTQPELYPSRYADFVITPPATFPVTVAVTNGAPTLSWPAVVGSTYSVYSSTNLLGPWTQTFGLGYYPSIGSYTDTNGAASAEFYRVSSF
jgi:hypothetical protein